MDGINYLVPVDARLERDVDVRYETVTLDLLVSTVGARLRLVILDACRINPSRDRCSGLWRAVPSIRPAALRAAADPAR